MRGSSLSSAWPAWQALERFKGLLAASDHDKEDAATSYTRYGGEDRCLCRYLRWCSFNETQARLPPGNAQVRPRVRQTLASPSLLPRC